MQRTRLVYDNKAEAVSPHAAEAKIQATRVFFENYNSEAKEIIDRGGAGSSKSYSLAQMFCNKLLTEKNKRILVVRKSLPSLRISVYQTMKEVLATFKATKLVKEEKVGMNWYYDTNYLHFGSVDNPEKLKSSDWNYIWMEEATDFTEEEFKIIRLRLRAPSSDGKKNQVFMSFNPIDEFHWIKTKIVDASLRGERKGVQEIVSTYQDNPFLPEDYVEELKALGQQDINHYRIYTLGEWGRMEHLIYTNWDLVSALPDDLHKMKVAYGLDFGFNAPSALIRIWIRGAEIWEEQLIYKKGLTNKSLIEQMELVIPPEHKRRVPIYADSAQPDRILEIQQAGFKCKLAQKNIQDGIDSVKRFKVHILMASDDLIKEKRAYSYKIDKKTGNITDEPIDFMNHLMDAERYAIHTHLKGSKEAKILWL